MGGCLATGMYAFSIVFLAIGVLDGVRRQEWLQAGIWFLLAVVVAVTWQKVAKQYQNQDDRSE